MSEVKEVRHAFGCSPEYPSSDDGSPPHHTDMDQTHLNLPTPLPSRRSATAPIPPREKHPLPLRRNKTSARLDALEHAYAVVADDASQIPVQDLVQASRLVHQIGAALNEQMSRKLDKS